MLSLRFMPPENVPTSMIDEGAMAEQYNKILMKPDRQSARAS